MLSALSLAGSMKIALWTINGISIVLQVLFCDAYTPCSAVVLKLVVLGIIGFFVIPVVGLFLGFVAGVFLSESARRRTSALTPWQATVQALKAVGTNILIEILAGLLIIGVWIASLVLPALF